MQTTFPKCNPTEMMGLLVLLNSHKGSEDVALLADDLDLEIDKIFPALEFAEVLQLVKVVEGRACVHRPREEAGGRLNTGPQGDHPRSTSQDHAFQDPAPRPGKRSRARPLRRGPGPIVSLTTAPADEAVQNIVNWGRYADLFRYDADERRLVLTRRAPASRPGPGRVRPPSPPGTTEHRPWPRKVVCFDGSPTTR